MGFFPAAILALLASAVWGAEPAAKKPFLDLREHASEYAGPERDELEPADVKEVLLGYFGPSDPKDPEGGDAWLAAQQAIEEANHEGGYRGKPFRLAPGWADQPWKNGAALVTRMVYVDKVWALVGGPDGSTTHLAEQIVAKARLPLVSPGSTDRTANLANVPWMFSLLPGDHLQAPVLADAICSRYSSRHTPCAVADVAQADGTRNVPASSLVILSTDDHDAKEFVREVRAALQARGLAPAYQFVCPASGDLSAIVAKAVQSRPESVLVAAGSQASARVVWELRKAEFKGAIFGGPSFGRRRFLEQAGPSAEGAIIPLLYAPGPTPDPFSEAFQKRHGHLPDYSAAGTYDAVRLVIAAVRKAGLNRARIGDALRSLAPWPGACGAVAWDKLGSNTRPVVLATIRAGRVARLE